MRVVMVKEFDIEYLYDLIKDNLHDYYPCQKIGITMDDVTDKFMIKMFEAMIEVAKNRIEKGE